MIEDKSDSLRTLVELSGKALLQIELFIPTICFPLRPEA
jgi:hypothetical protein